MTFNPKHAPVALHFQGSLRLKTQYRHVFPGVFVIMEENNIFLTPKLYDKFQN